MCISFSLLRSYYINNFSVLVRSPIKYTYSSLFTILFTYSYCLLHVRPHMGHLQGETYLQETHVTHIHIKCSSCMCKIKYVFILSDWREFSRWLNMHLVLCHSFVCLSWTHLLCYICNGLKQEFTLLSCDIKERFSLIIQIQNDATQHCCIRQSCWLYTDCRRQMCPLTVQIQNVNTKGDIHNNTIQDNNRKYVRFYVVAWEVTFQDF